MFDFGLENQNFYSSYYASSGEKQHSASNNMNIHHIAMSFPVYNRIIMGVGLFPYSSVGYKMQRKGDRDHIIAESGPYDYRYEGEGGITQGMLSLGVPIGRRISLGGQAHYYFGSIDRYNIIDFETAGFFDQTSGQLIKVSNFGFSVGAQYEQPLKNDLSLTLGASYQFATKIGKRKIDFTTTTTGSVIDTVAWNVNTGDPMSLPATISAGVSLHKLDNWIFGVDYVLQQWEQTGFTNQSTTQTFKVVPGHLVRTGFEWTPSRTDFRHYYNRCSYRVGFSYESTYMQFSGHNINNVSATIGLGLPINRWNNSVNFSAEIGKRGTTGNGLISETYVKFSFSFSVYDIWFIKPKIE
jgi:hypothetical protein